MTSRLRATHAESIAHGYVHHKTIGQPSPSATKRPNLSWPGVTLEPRQSVAEG